MSFIEVKNLTKKYGDFYALKDLSLDFEKKGQYAILGASGSGKSTLLYHLGGLDRPTSGDILVDGKNVGELPDKLLAEFRNRSVGFIFQFHFLLSSMTCLENILLPAQIAGLKDASIPNSCKNLAIELGVDHCLQKYPYQLSGGEQQRINIIRALSLRPKVLLCDEPTGSLDSENSQKVTEMLKKLASEFEATLIVVTHDANIASHFDSQYHFKDGYLIN